MRKEKRSIRNYFLPTFPYHSFVQAPSSKLLSQSNTQSTSIHPLNLHYDQVWRNNSLHPISFPTERDNKCHASNSPEEAFISLSQQGGLVSESSVEKIYNALQPIKSSFLIGDWDGGNLDTGHPGYKTLTEMRWAGKNFRSIDDVDPIVVLDEADRRVFGEDWGHASVS